LLTEVKHLAQQHQYISASFLQRRLHIGYPRAARLIDALEKEEQDKNARPESLSKSNPTSNPDEDHR
jgi:DNA segregation ATPase FtsK/SpoIIIE-like protein